MAIKPGFIGRERMAGMQKFQWKWRCQLTLVKAWAAKKCRTATCHEFICLACQIHRLQTHDQP
jgi:hypothetical protein